MNESEARKELASVCRRLYDRKLTVSAGGNMSVRCGDGILITPSGRNKGSLTPEDMIFVTMGGKASGGKPSIETGFHLALYRGDPDVGAVVHCHPLHCIALTMNGKLRTGLTPEGVMLLGDVPVIPYLTPGSRELADAVAAHAGSPAILMERHGAITCGRTLAEAYDRMEELEFQAELSLLCPGADDLPEDEMKRLEALRWRYLRPNGSARSCWTRRPEG